MKKERGAITLITLATILFMIAFLISTFTIIMNRRQVQAEIKKETKEIYENEVENAGEVYKSFFADANSLIPINVAEYLPKVHTGENIVVDGKIYKCSEDAEYNFADELEWTAMPVIYGNSQVISSKVESVGEKVVDTTDPNYGKYKIPVVVSGKNLFDYTKLFTGKGYNGSWYVLNADNTVTIEKNNSMYGSAGSDIFFLKAGEYSISADIKKTSAVTDAFYGFKISKVPIETPAGKGTTVSGYIAEKIASTTEFERVKKEKFTITESGYYSFTAQMSKTGCIFKNVLIEKGATATEYEAFNGMTVDIYLDEPLRKVGDYVDYIDIKNGKIVRNVEVASTTATTVETALKGLATPKTQNLTISKEIKGKGKQILRVDTTVEPSRILTYYK